MKNSGLLNQVLDDIESQGQPSIHADDVLPMAVESIVAVADNPLKYWVNGKSGTDAGVLFISNENHPLLMSRAVKRGAEALTSLSPKCGSVILKPLCSGEVSGRSYGLWPRQRSLSTNRIKRYVQRKALIPYVLEWTMQLAEETAVELDSRTREDLFDETLSSLASDDRFDESISDSCNRACERLRSGVWVPKTVLAHNDLWMDNVLLRSRDAQTSSDSYPFVVIDWAGSKLKGYPFYDLIRFMLSAGIGAKAAGTKIHIYCELMGCEPEDTMGYVLASLGGLGRKLEQFPEERYVALVTQCYAYIQESIR